MQTGIVMLDYVLMRFSNCFSLNASYKIMARELFCTNKVRCYFVPHCYSCLCIYNFTHV